MHFKNANTASHAVADMANDVWQKRDQLIGEQPLFLSYRICVTDGDTFQDVNMFFHVAMLKDRWFYLVSDQPAHEICDADIIQYEHQSPEPFDYNIRGESWRHYLFSDGFQPAIEKRLEDTANSLGNASGFFLWDTLPLSTLRKATDA